MLNLRKRFTTISYSTVLTLLCACGGGGGSDSSGGDVLYPGVWNTHLSLSRNSCPFSPQYLGLNQTMDILYQVNQDGNNIVVDNLSSKATLSGSTIKDGNGFVVTTAGAVGQCKMTVSLAFNNIDGDSADAGLGIDILCPADKCAIGYSGYATRQ